MKLQYLLLLLFCLFGWAWAAEVQGTLVVEVVRFDNDAPVPGAAIRVIPKGSTLAVDGKTDSDGKARFSDLTLGDYYVEVEHPDFSQDRTLIKLNPGADNVHRVYLSPKGEDQVIRVRVDRLLVDTHNPLEGAVTRRDRDFVERQVADNSLQGILSTIPGTERNSLGQTHVRGEHKSVTFSLDGVTIPVPLASTTSQPLEADFLDSLDVRTGMFDASQGGQIGMVVNAVTMGSNREPFTELETRVGNLGQLQNTLRSGGTSADGNFNYFVGARTSATDINFEAPDPDQQTLNNRGTSTSLLVRMAGKTEDDQVGLTLSYQNADYQIPQTPSNFAAGVRQYQNDGNALGVLSWKRKLTDSSDLLMGLAYLRSKQSVRNNGLFTPWDATPEEFSPELAEEGLPLDPTNPGSPYLPISDLEVTQLQPSLSYTYRLGDNHRITAGVTADFIRSRQNLSITDPGGGGGIPNPFDPGAPAAALDARIDRNAFVGGAFFTHTIPVSEALTLNYGLRADTFDNGINLSTGQLSPSLNLSYAVNENQVLRASYNRVFQAPPLELDVTGQVITFPQRISAYELSYEAQLDRNLTAKLALVRKDYRDQVDIGLLIPNSNIPVFAPVNFGTARYQGLEFSLNSSNPTGWNGFLTTTWSSARPLTPGPFTTELPAYNDHDQRVQVTGGLSHTWDGGFTAAADFYYGSGFPQQALGLYNEAGISPYGLGPDRIARFLVNLNLNYFPKEEGPGPQFGGGLQVLNLFDDRPLLNFFSEFSGTRFISQRRVLLNAVLRF